KPAMNHIGSSHRTLPRHSVAIHTKNCTAVGMAISVLAIEKNPAAGIDKPTVNIWWAQSTMLSMPIVTTLATTHRYATTGRPAKVGSIAVTMPAAGTKMM